MRERPHRGGEEDSSSFCSSGVEKRRRRRWKPTDYKPKQQQQQYHHRITKNHRLFLCVLRSPSTQDTDGDIPMIVADRETLRHRSLTDRTIQPCASPCFTVQQWDCPGSSRDKLLSIMFFVFFSWGDRNIPSISP